MNNKKNQINHRFKMVFIGDANVGKTKLVARYVRNDYTDEYSSTIGAEFCIKNLNENDRNIQLHIWDCAGREGHRSLVPMYLRGAVATFIVFDLTNEASFNHVSDWLQEILDDRDVFIVGTKADLVDQRVVKKEAIDELISKFPGKVSNYVETSSKNTSNIDLLFETATKCVLARVEQQAIDKSNAQEDKPERTSLISDLQLYVNRVKSHQKNGRINFRHGFWHHRDSRALNREANYELAKYLLTKLTTTDDTIESIFNDTNGKRNRIFDATKMSAQQYKNRGINSSTLNKIIKKAELSAISLRK